MNNIFKIRNSKKEILVIYLKKYCGKEIHMLSEESIYIQE